MTTVVNFYHLSKSDQQKVRDGELPGYVYVGRSSNQEIGKWGNRYSHRPSSLEGVIKVKDAQTAVDRYAADKWAEPGFIAQVRRELRGKKLVCYCGINSPCHARWLASIADGAVV